MTPRRPSNPAAWPRWATAFSEAIRCHPIIWAQRIRRWDRPRPPSYRRGRKRNQESTVTECWSLLPFYAEHTGLREQNVNTSAFRELRKQAGLSVREAARALGIPVKLVSQLETGAANLPVSAWNLLFSRLKRLRPLGSRG